MDNETNFIDSDGNFTDDFASIKTEILGEEHKNSKVFDDVKDIKTLAKNYFFTKQAVGKKLENVIQKPGEKATDQEKAEYKAALLKEIGVPEKAEAYNIDLSEIKDVVQFDDTDIAAIKEAAHKTGATQEVMDSILGTYKGIIAKQVQAQNEEKQRQFTEESAVLKKAWAGDAMMENPRLAFTAINQFCDDTFKDILKNSGVYSDPTNLDKWLKAGISPSQLHIWGNIGKRMKMGTVLNNAGAELDTDSPRAQAMKMYPNSEELWPKE